MAELTITLNAKEMETFIDLWEAQRCLWDPSDQHYKHRGARIAALSAIAELFGCGWTVEEVKRKLESLKAYYRKQKRKKAYATTTARGVKKNWFFYDRIHSFLGGVQYDSSNVTVRNSVEEAAELIPQEEEDNSGSVASSASSDIDLLTRCTQLQRTEQVVTESLYSQPETAECIGDVTSPPLKCRVLGTGRKQIKVPKADYHEIVVNYIKDLQESRKKLENPHMNYALTVVERLAQVKNAKRVTILKHKIDNLLYEAMMEEMADDEINTKK